VAKNSNNAVAVIPPMLHCHVSFIYCLFNWQCSLKKHLPVCIHHLILPVFMKSWTLQSILFPYF